MHVEAADAEGVDRREPGRAVGMGRPRQRGSGNGERATLPVERAAEFVTGGAGRDEPVLDRQHDLDEAGDAGGLERVADVRLHGADGKLAGGRDVSCHHPRERRKFGRVAHLRARRVRLDVLETAEVVRVGIGPLHGSDLPLLPRSPEALALAVAGYAEAPNHRPDTVAVGHGTRERLEDDRHVAFGRDESVGGLAERARPGRADRLGCREEHEAVGLAVGGAAHDGLVDRPLQERSGRDGQGLEGRGAGRVDDEVRAAQPQRLAHDAGRPDGAEIETLARRAPGIAPAHPRGDLRGDRTRLVAENDPGGVHVGEHRRRLVDPACVDDVADLRAAAGVADVDAGPSVRGHGEGIEARVVAGLRRHFQEEVVGDVIALEEVVGDRTATPIDRPVRDDAADVGVGPTDLSLFGIEVEIPTKPGFGQRPPGRAALHHEPPERLEPVSSRQPAGHADDRERLRQNQASLSVVDVCRPRPAPPTVGAATSAVGIHSRRGPIRHAPLLRRRGVRIHAWLATRWRAGETIRRPSGV